jgi:hypothetical protein
LPTRFVECNLVSCKGLWRLESASPQDDKDIPLFPTQFSCEARTYTLIWLYAPAVFNFRPFIWRLPDWAPQSFRNFQDWSHIGSGKLPKTIQNRRSTGNSLVFPRNSSGIFRFRPQMLTEILQIDLTIFLENPIYIQFPEGKTSVKNTRPQHI